MADTTSELQETEIRQKILEIKAMPRRTEHQKNLIDGTVKALLDFFPEMPFSLSMLENIVELAALAYHPALRQRCLDSAHDMIRRGEESGITPYLSALARFQVLKHVPQSQQFLRTNEIFERLEKARIKLPARADLALNVVETISPGAAHSFLEKVRNMIFAVRNEEKQETEPRSSYLQRMANIHILEIRLLKLHPESERQDLGEDIVNSIGFNMVMGSRPHLQCMQIINDVVSLMAPSDRKAEALSAIVTLLHIRFINPEDFETETPEEFAALHDLLHDLIRPLSFADRREIAFSVIEYVPASEEKNLAALFIQRALSEAQEGLRTPYPDTIAVSPPIGPDIWDLCIVFKKVTDEGAPLIVVSSSVQALLPEMKGVSFITATREETNEVIQTLESGENTEIPDLTEEQRKAFLMFARFVSHYIPETKVPETRMLIPAP